MNNISFNPLAWAIRPLYNKAIEEDDLFAEMVREKESRAEKPKSIGECADYILGEAFHWAEEHKIDNSFSYAGLPDDEVLNLIKHYYDEDDIEIRKVNARASVSAPTKEQIEEQKRKRDEQKAKDKIVKMNIPTMSKEQIESQAKTALLQAQNQQKSKEQASTEKVLDMFAGMDDDDDSKEEQKDPAPLFNRDAYQAKVKSGLGNIISVFDRIDKENEEEFAEQADEDAEEVDEVEVADAEDDGDLPIF